MSYADVRHSRTGKLLLRYDPVRKLVEISDRMGDVYVVDLSQYEDLLSPVELIELKMRQLAAQMDELTELKQGCTSCCTCAGIAHT